MAPSCMMQGKAAEPDEIKNQMKQLPEQVKALLEPCPRAPETKTLG